MAVYYVGSGGNDANDGLSWAQRFLTLNGAEDEPVAANDTVYVAPGVYRELLTCDVSGSAGNPITYIGDVTGEHTDSVGGIVRITGSDNDTTAARANCITSLTKNYRTFRGFCVDSATTYGIINNGGTNWIIEDCAFNGDLTAGSCIEIIGAAQADNIIRRCFLFGSGGIGIRMQHSSQLDDTGHLVENCYILCFQDDGIQMNRAFGVTVRNCAVLACSDGIDSVTAGTGTETAIVVENCIVAYSAGNGFESAALGDIVEDYNNVIGNGTARSNVNVGGNSTAYPILPLPPILHAGASQASGFVFPWGFGALSEWSPIRAITGSNEPGVDMFGVDRPATAAKNSWGPVQFHDAERETTTVYDGSDASIVFNDAGRHQMWVPVTAVSTTISVRAYREADYAGTNPQMVIKQPGQSDRTTTDVAAASQWNELTDTFTPSALPPYVIVELVSNNTDTANAATNDCFFDSLAVS